MAPMMTIERAMTPTTRSIDAIRADFADIVAAVIHDRDFAPEGAALARLERIAATMGEISDIDMSHLALIDDALGGVIASMLRLQLLAITMGALPAVVDAPTLLRPVLAAIRPAPLH